MGEEDRHSDPGHITHGIEDLCWHLDCLFAKWSYTFENLNIINITQHNCSPDVYTQCPPS